MTSAARHRDIDPWEDYGCHGCGRSIEPADPGTLWSEYSPEGWLDANGEPHNLKFDGFVYFWHPQCWPRRSHAWRWRQVESEPVNRQRYRA